MLRGAYVTMLLDPPSDRSRAALLDDLTELVIRMLREPPARIRAPAGPGSGRAG